MGGFADHIFRFQKCAVDFDDIGCIVFVVLLNR
jgi:hypothetical protein